MDRFLDEVRRHASKVEYVPVDVSQFSAQQRTVIRRFLDGLGNPNVFIVGDYGSIDVSDYTAPQRAMVRDYVDGFADSRVLIVGDE